MFFDQGSPTPVVSPQISDVFTGHSLPSELLMGWSVCSWLSLAPPLPTQYGYLSGRKHREEYKDPKPTGFSLDDFNAAYFAID